MRALSRVSLTEDRLCDLRPLGGIAARQDLPPDVSVALASYKRTKRGGYDKIAALTLLFKHFGLLQKRVHVGTDWNKLAERLASSRKRHAAIP